MIEHFFTVLVACGGLPPSTTTWSPTPPECGGASLWRKKEPRHYIPCPPLFQGKVASAASRKGSVARRPSG